MKKHLYYPLPKKDVREWPGDRGGGNVHAGTDWAVPEGTPARAAFDGVVIFAGGDGSSGELYPGSGIWANGEGQTIRIRRSDGLVAVYGHLSKISVKVGQKVKAKQTIGRTGNTGYSTGPHLHWEIRWDELWNGGRWVDPRKLGAVDFPKPKPKRIIVQTTYTPKTPIPVLANETKYLPVGEGVPNAVGALKSGLLTAHVIVKGVPGTIVELTVLQLKFTSSGRIVNEKALRDKTLVIPSNGMIKDHIIVGFKTPESERLRPAIRRASAPVSVTRIGTDTLLV